MRLCVLAFLLFGVSCRTPPVGQEFRIPLGERLVLHLTEAPFDSAAHTIALSGSHASGYVYAIDGNPFFGSDGETPRTTLTSANLEVNGQQVPLDVRGMFNPMLQRRGPDYFQVEPYFGGWIVRGLFSDGAGSYMAEWIAFEGGSLRTIVTNNDVVIQTLFGGD